MVPGAGDLSLVAGPRPALIDGHPVHPSTSPSFMARSAAVAAGAWSSASRRPTTRSSAARSGREVRTWCPPAAGARPLRGPGLAGLVSGGSGSPPLRHQRSVRGSFHPQRPDSSQDLTRQNLARRVDGFSNSREQGLRIPAISNSGNSREQDRVRAAVATRLRARPRSADRRAAG